MNALAINIAAAACVVMVIGLLIALAGAIPDHRRTISVGMTIGTIGAIVTSIAILASIATG